MNRFKKFVLGAVVGAVVTAGYNTTQAYSFLDKIRWSHAMSSLLPNQQKEGFLLHDLQRNATDCWMAVSTRNQSQFTNLLGQNNYLELQYDFQNCLDLTINHASKKDKLVPELVKLSLAFNHQLKPITQASFAAVSPEQIGELKKAHDALSQFTKTYSITSKNARDAIKALQQEAKNDQPIQSIFRKEYVVPALLVTGAICSIFLWNKWLSTKFWEWWNSPSSNTLNKDVTIGTALCKGEELTLKNNVHVIQLKVTGQSGATCGQHALLNAVTLLSSINSPNLSSELNNSATASATITEMKDNLLTTVSNAGTQTRASLTNKLAAPNALHKGDLLPLAQFLQKKNKLNLPDFMHLFNQSEELGHIGPVHVITEIKQNKDLTEDVKRQHLAAILQRLNIYNHELFGKITEQALTIELTEQGIEALQNQVNGLINNHETALLTNMRDLINPLLAQLTPEEREEYITLQVTNQNNIDQNAEFINGATIDNLIKSKYATHVPNITVIDAPGQLVPTPDQLLAASTNPIALNHLFTSIKNRFVQPGEYMHAFVLGNMQQVGDTVGIQRGFAHWITLVVRKLADGTRHYIITDSMNRRYIDDAIIRRVITALEGEDIWK